MKFSEIESGEQETPQDEMKHSGKFLALALKMKKEKKSSAKVGSKAKRHQKSGGGKSFGKSAGK